MDWDLTILSFLDSRFTWVWELALTIIRWLIHTMIQMPERRIILISTGHMANGAKDSMNGQCLLIST